MSKDIEAGRAFVRLAMKDEAFRKGIAAARARLDSFGKGVQALGRGMAGIGAIATGMGGAILAALNPAVQAASDLGETISKAGEIFGKEALPALLAFAETAADTMGQSKQQALDAAATFAIFGKSAGLAGNDLVGFSKELVVLASDLASFHNKSPEEAIVALGAALRGESEPIRNFGVMLDDATLRAAALEKGLIKTTKNSLTPQQRVLAAHAVIMKQTVDAQGDYIRTAGGMANMQRTMVAQWKDIQTALGEALLPTMTDFLGIVGDAVKAIAKWAGENKQLVGIVATVGAGLTAAGTIVTTFGVALTGVGMAISAITPIATALFSPAGLLVAGVAASVAAVAKESELFRTTVIDAFNGVLSVAKATGEGISSALSVGDLQAAWEIAMLGLEVGFKTTLNKMLDAVAVFADEMAKMIGEALKPQNILKRQPGYQLGLGMAGWMTGTDVGGKEGEGIIDRIGRALETQEQEKELARLTRLMNTMRANRSAPVKGVTLPDEVVESDGSVDIKEAANQDWKAVAANRRAPVKAVTFPDEAAEGAKKIADAAGGRQTAFFSAAASQAAWGGMGSIDKAAKRDDRRDKFLEKLVKQQIETQLALEKISAWSFTE